MFQKMAKPGGKARPHRVQLRRSKGWRMPGNSAKVDRSTLFGNPFRVSEYGHDRAVALHRAWITGRPIDTPMASARRTELTKRRAEVLRALPGLRGKNLACWCPLPREGEADSCHALVLLELANR
jgi:Domain of unknown function (DUF4326)